jgi:hypothetical protein
MPREGLHVGAPQDVIGTTEAAEILGLQPRAVRDLVKNGYLYPVRDMTPPIQHYRFKREDVTLLAEVRAQPVDLAGVISMARHAAFTARKLEVLVARLMSVMGADIPVAELDREAVEAMYLRMQAALEVDEYDTEAVFKWARIFFSMGEEYFDALEVYTGDREPWLIVSDLSRRILLRGIEQGKFNADVETTAAYQYLTLANRTVRQAAFFYVRRRHSRDISATLFPEATKDVHESLSALSFTIFG